MKKIIDARMILDFQQTAGNQFVNRLLRGRQTPVMPVPQEEKPEAPVPPATRPWRVRLIIGIFSLFRVNKRTTVAKPDGTTAN